MGCGSAIKSLKCRSMLRYGWTSKTLCQVKEARLKRHVLYDSIHMNYPNRRIQREKEHIGGCQSWGRWGERSDHLMGTSFLLRWWKYFGTDSSSGCATCEYTKCHWLLYFKMVNFVLCEFNANKNNAKQTKKPPGSWLLLSLGLVSLLNICGIRNPILGCELFLSGKWAYQNL